MIAAGSSSPILWGLVLAVHLLAMAAWTGGLAYALLVTRPALAVLDPAPRAQVQAITLKRFFLVVWHAMPLSIITGYAMVFGVYGGFANLDWSVNAMMALGLLMALVFLLLFFGPYKKLRRAIRPGPETLARIRGMVGLDLLLGIATVVVASLGHFG